MMRSSLYKTTGWLAIAAGLLWFLGNVYYNVIGNLRLFADFGPGTIFMELFVGGVLGSIGILLVFLLPGIFYLKVGDRKIMQNRLISWAAGLTLCGVILMLLVAIISSMAFCRHNWTGYECVIPVFFLGVIPAGVLYGIGLILLIINWLKR